MTPLIERFIKYVKFETTSDENSGVTPSTPTQMVFAKELKMDLEEMGLSEVELDDNGYLYATLPANTDKPIPTLGFIAHMDTAPDMSGKDVKPRIVEKYAGGPITLNDKEGIILDPAQFPELNDHIGQDLIVTDGTTLLGADDKAGIAEIVSAIEWFQQHPEVKHGKIRIGFNPDEEIGLGAHKFDVEKFGCEWAYTMDGGAEGELEYENFNAASAKITIKGLNVHPGMAKNKMINAILVGNKLMSLLPESQTPATTEKYEGFYHIVGIEGTVEECRLTYIIRDHDRQRFEERKAEVERIVAFINGTYGDIATVELKDQYYNMREKIEPVMHIIETAEQAMERAGVKPKVQPIRGGTDGAQLSFKNLPCPNIFAGGMNMHGRYEYVSIQAMEKAMMTVVEICKIVAEK